MKDIRQLKINSTDKILDELSHRYQLNKDLIKGQKINILNCYKIQYLRFGSLKFAKEISTN